MVHSSLEQLDLRLNHYLTQQDWLLLLRFLRRKPENKEAKQLLRKYRETVGYGG